MRSLGKTTDREYVPKYTFMACAFDMKQPITHVMFNVIMYKVNKMFIFIIEDCDLAFSDGNQKNDIVQ